MIPRTGITVSKKELLGLLLVFIAYVLLGGLVFMLLESPLEEQQRRELELLRNEFEDKLGRLGSSNVSRGDLERLMLRLASAHGQALIDEQGNDTHANWSFSNAFFFAITVVTTIGYGHLSPSTTPGRLFCVLYATIGIPLTGILLAAIGGHYSQKLVRGLQRARKGRNSKLALCLSAAKCLLPWLFVFLVVPAGFFMWLEQWSFVESFYYCFITLSTIGFGDYVAGNFEGGHVGVYKTAVVLWIVFGLGYLAMILNYISRMMRCKQIRRVERRLSTSIHHTQQKVGQRLDEVYHILQEVSRNRTIRNRAALKRMQSFPAPELKDQNHNHKIQKLMTLVQSLREDQAPKDRRYSLPLPTSPTLQSSSNQGRGSLQTFSTSLKQEHEVVRMNGVHQKRLVMADFEMCCHQDRGGGIEFTVPTRAEDVVEVTNNNYGPKVTGGVDVISGEPPLEALADRKTIIDLEGLQCTSV